jgi:hypothetical protein
MPVLAFSQYSTGPPRPIRGFSEFRSRAELAPLPSGSAIGDVVGLVVACIQEDVPPRDREKPARHLAAALSARNGLDALPFISRDLSIFVGWC